MSMIGALEVERFLIEEASLLDRGAYEAWVDLFTPDGW
jgi:3-phenylpropionate/cinnamic acid dioxygenase small subunit